MGNNDFKTAITESSSVSSVGPVDSASAAGSVDASGAVGPVDSADHIGIIGPGRVGLSLGRYLIRQGVNTGAGRDSGTDASPKGFSFAGFFARNPKAAREAAELTHSEAFSSLEDIVSRCGIIFITVPDTSISEVWESLMNLNLDGKVICHCSGALSSSVFEGAEAVGAYPCSLHPIYAVYDRENAWREFENVSFTIEGNANGRAVLRRLMESLGNKVGEIEAGKKTLYHAACVFFSNLVVGLAGLGEDIFAECGFEPDFSSEAWKSLFLGNAGNICRAGVNDALTGPAERGDASVVKAHLCALEPPARAVYLELTKVLLGIAGDKHPDRDYSELKNVLEQL